MRVLVVDDFPTMRRIIRNVLRQIHVENTLEAENGKEAMELLRTEEIDLIICDWIMPEMSGLELLRACKKDAKTSHIPFIMVTAEAAKESVVEAIEAGVDNYITKPFTSDKLQDAINKATVEATK